MTRQFTHIVDMAGGFGDVHSGRLTPYQLLLVAGMLCTGCINILVKKFAYQTSSKGALSDGFG